jgi:cytoskeletal protein CcmA (bactofilin family)
MADMEARDIVIYGFVEGNIRAAGRLELRESAEVKGDIHAERLSIEENASLKGRVELSELAPGSGPGRQAAADPSGTNASAPTLA